MVGRKTSSLIGRVGSYITTSTYVLSLDSRQNLFDKPNEQSQSLLDCATERKGGRKPIILDLIFRAKSAWKIAKAPVPVTY